MLRQNIILFMAVLALLGCGRKGSDNELLQGHWLLESVVEPAAGRTTPVAENQSRYLRFQSGRFVIVSNANLGGATAQDQHVFCDEQNYSNSGQLINTSAGRRCNAQEFRIEELSNLRLRLTDTARPSAQQVYIKKSPDYFSAALRLLGLTEADLQ